jgi:hypothetical protein
MQTNMYFCAEVTVRNFQASLVNMVSMATLIIMVTYGIPIQPQPLGAFTMITSPSQINVRHSTYAKAIDPR